MEELADHRGIEYLDGIGSKRAAATVHEIFSGVTQRCNPVKKNGGFSVHFGPLEIWSKQLLLS